MSRVEGPQPTQSGPPKSRRHGPPFQQAGQAQAGESGGRVSARCAGGQLQTGRVQLAVLEVPVPDRTLNHDRGDGAQPLDDLSRFVETSLCVWQAARTR